jgi:hypothetical protein
MTSIPTIASKLTKAQRRYERLRVRLARTVAIDERLSDEIGRLMSRRVDNENLASEILAEMRDLSESSETERLGRVAS